MYKLELVNKKTKEVTIFDDIADINYGEKLFFNFEINATQLADGEYTLSLFEDGKLIVTDTLCVGDFDVVGLQYKKDEAIYIETKLKTKTQDKSVKVSDIATTIIPDEGYDAMTTVEVNAQPVYDGAYNAGKEEGKEEGKQEGIEEGKEIQKGKLESITITENGVYTKEDGYGKVTVDVGQISGINFSLIGYDKELSDELNAKWNSDVEYSKTLLDAWDPATITAEDLYRDNKQLIYAPNIDTSNVTTMMGMFYGCEALTVVPLLDTSKVISFTNTFNHCSSLKSIPQFNTSDVWNMGLAFANCPLLTTIPLLDTSKVTVMNSTFYGCTSLTTIPLLNTSKVDTMEKMFNDCTSLTTLPLLNTSSVTNMAYMFDGCESLTTIPAFNTSNVTKMNSMFVDCKSLVSIPLLDASKVTNIGSMFGYSNNTSLTNFGGLKDLKIDWNSYGSPKYLPNLTYQSVMNIINNLYDFRGNGDATTTRTIQLNTNSLALLSDADKAIATSKGWVITA